MMLADRPAGITLSRQTMAPVCLLRLPRWQYRANICTNRPTTTRCTAPWPSWAKRGRHLDVAERSCQPAAMSFRNRKSARAAFWCMALIAVITAVNASVIARSDSPRRVRTIITDKVPRSLRLNPLVWEQPRYSLCTCVTQSCTVLPRAHTVSVAVTIRLRDVKRACFQRPKAGWQSGTTSSGRSRRLYFLPTYPYPTHGGAGPVSGGHRGRQGSVQNPDPLQEDRAGKGVKA